VIEMVKKDCENFDKCVRYTEMTKNPHAIDCEGCPAYKPN